MIFKEKKLKGVYEIQSSLHKDQRGIFRRSFCRKLLKLNNIDFSVAQANISENFRKYTLRGFHYQSYPNSENKIIYCISGSIYNVVIDLRKKSKTYKKWIALTLSNSNRKGLIVPSGCANAFLTLDNNTIVHYYMSNYFNPDSYKSIRYNDPVFKVRWPYKPKIISKRDLNIKNFNEKN